MSASNITRDQRELPSEIITLVHLGLNIIAVHNVRDDGRCSCGKDCGDSAGKHPRGIGWQKKATNDLGLLKKIYRDYPDTNWGIATDESHWILDVDLKNGGLESLKRLLEKYGPLPPTLKYTTGGGGQQFVFKNPGLMIKTVANAIPGYPGIDTRGIRGMGTCPPSKHKSGRKYRFDSPDDVTTIAEAPAWLINSLQSKGQQQVVACSVSSIPIGARNATLTSIAGSLRSKGLSEDAILNAIEAINGDLGANRLPDTEIRTIAKSIGSYEPGKLIVCDSQSDEKKTWPKEISPSAYYGLPGAIVKTISPHSESDPVALLVQFLAAVGILMGANAGFRVESSWHYARGFIVVVGDTAKARKGTSWEHIRRVLSLVCESWVKDNVVSGLSSGEGLIWSVRDAIIGTREVLVKGKKTGEFEKFVQDQGIEDKRLLVQEGEFASVLKAVERDGNTLSPVIRNAWDSGQLSTLTKNNPAKASEAHIGIIAHITETEFRRLLNSTEIANGFGNRFLLICAKRSKLLPLGGSLQDSDFRLFVEPLMRAIEKAKVKRQIGFDGPAEKMWREIYPTLSAAQSGLVGSLTARAEAHVVRLALTYALLDCADAISKQHLEAGLAVWNYCADSCKHIFGNATGNPVADEIQRALKNAPAGLTRTDIHGLFKNNRTAAAIGAALAELSNASLAFAIVQETAGKSAERWFYGKPNTEIPTTESSTNIQNSLN